MITDKRVDYKYRIVLFARQVSPDYWTGFFSSKSSVWDAEDKAKLVHVSAVHPNDVLESDYWAWWDHTSYDRPLKFIWASRLQVAMCFPYGPEIETKSGKGEIIRVRFSVIESPT